MRRRTIRSRTPLLRAAFALFGLLLSAACGAEERAWGEPNGIIVAAEPDLWGEVEDTVYAVLEQTVRAVRDEKTFRLTWQDPTESRWAHLRRFRQLLLIGTRDDSWVSTALERTREAIPDPPAVVQASDVWARGQVATVLLLPPGGSAEEIEPLLRPARELLVEQFHQYARGRMFLSGRDTALTTTLAGEAGFSLLLPEVYQWERRDSVYKFRNDNPDPSELIREIVVTWRPLGSGGFPDAGEILEWRQALVSEHYGYPQVLDTTRLEVEEGEVRDRSYREVRAVWANPPEDDFPAAGPFRTRVIRCPSQDRLYLVDAWLYAPGRDKWEYLIQLDTILASFRCGDGAGPSG